MKSGKVLILSQKQESVTNIAQILRGLGYTITISPNAKETIDLAHSLKPQLIFWGEQLKLDTKKAIRELKETDFGDNLIVMGISLSDEIKLYDRIEAQHYGIDDFIQLNPDPAELETKINLQHSLREKIEIHSQRAEKFKRLSETNFNLMLSQGLENSCELVIDHLTSNFDLTFLLFAVYNPSLKDFDYFNLLLPGQERSIDLDSIMHHPIWEAQFFQNGDSAPSELKNDEVLKVLDGWNIEFDKIYQYPMQYKGKSIGTILMSFKSGRSVDPEEEMMLSSISQAMAYRIMEIRRIYGLGRYRSKEDPSFSGYLRRPSEGEILIFLSHQLIRQLQADICLYMNYHEGFRFLYPQYLYKEDSDQNLFEREKPPVLLIKDFPTFDKLLTDKNTLILDMRQSGAASDVKRLPGFKTTQMNNVVIFLLMVEQTVEGFFVLGRESIIKKFHRSEIQENERLISYAIEALEENQILRQAKLTVKQLERIFELGTELTLDLTLDNILKKICTAIRRTIGWNIVILDLKNPFDNTYKTINVLGMKDADYQKLTKKAKYPPFKDRIDTSHKISESFFYNHQLENIKDEGVVRRDYTQYIGTEWNDNDWFYVPITSRGEVLGMFSLNDPVERLRPNEDRIKSVEFFANQAAVVIENTELFEKLKSSELRYRLLAETMTMGLVTCDVTGKIIYINNSLTRLLKYEAKRELQNRKLFEFCTTNSVHKLQKEVINTLAEKKKVEQPEPISGLEIELIAQDEESIPFMIYTSPFYQQQQKVGFFAVLADLRSQKKIERLRADFNSMIVHDLRSPLNIIQGYVDIVRNEVVGKINEEQAELLTIAKENVYKLLKLIDNFLIASKLEVGHLEIEPEVNSINALVEELYEHYQVLVKEKKLKLIKKLDENIPYLNFDKFRIEQVIRNYLSNAIKFTPPEGRITISSKLKKKENEITGDIDMFVDVSVADTGVGISKDEQKKVFNKYEQTEAGKDASLKGTGLGLAICREIVELHKGEVWVESKINEGSKFGFTLPIQPLDI